MDKWGKEVLKLGAIHIHERNLEALTWKRQVTKTRTDTISPIMTRLKISMVQRTRWTYFEDKKPLIILYCDWLLGCQFQGTRWKSLIRAKLVFNYLIRCQFEDTWRECRIKLEVDNHMVVDANRLPWSLWRLGLIITYLNLVFSSSYHHIHIICNLRYNP